MNYKSLKNKKNKFLSRKKNNKTKKYFKSKNKKNKFLSRKKNNKTKKYFKSKNKKTKKKIGSGPSPAEKRKLKIQKNVQTIRDDFFKLTHHSRPPPSLPSNVTGHLEDPSARPPFSHIPPYLTTHDDEQNLSNNTAAPIESTYDPNLEISQQPGLSFFPVVKYKDDEHNLFDNAAAPRESTVPSNLEIPQHHGLFSFPPPRIPTPKLTPPPRSKLKPLAKPKPKRNK